MPKTRKPLTLAERKAIELCRARGESCRAIGRQLDRSHTDVTREIHRNAGWHSVYSSTKAELRAEKRLFGKRSKKLEVDTTLKTAVLTKLRDNYSPEQISGRLQTENPTLQISHETIYRYIYSDEGRQAKLARYLRHKKPRRRSHHARITRNIILERVSIHERPAEIAKKKIIGHFESDTVESGRAGRGGLSVQYERVSSFCRLTRLLTKTAEETKVALLGTINSLPPAFVKSITFDNGREGALHHEVRRECEIETYFCDPYCSWQKPGVENLNGLIREFFPKKTDFARVTDEEVAEVERKLNNRPRKRLGYRTPLEFLSGLTSGAINS